MMMIYWVMEAKKVMTITEQTTQPKVRRTKDNFNRLSIEIKLNTCVDV